MAPNPYHHRMSSPFTTFMTITFTSLALTVIVNPSKAATDNYIYVGCSQIKYSPNTPYQDNLNSLLTSISSSAAYTSFNKYTVSPNTSDVVYGLHQCRPDLDKQDCARCISRSLSQLGELCGDSTGGVIRLEGCFVRYDNVSFLGVEDETVVERRCGDEGGVDCEGVGAVLDDLLGARALGGGLYRVGRSGNAKGVAECSGDLSGSQCQDCISEAVRRLRSACDASSDSGDMFLATCYARYSVAGPRGAPPGGPKIGPEQNNDVDRTLAIIIGMIAGIALLILFLSFIRQSREEAGKLEKNVSKDQGST